MSVKGEKVYQKIRACQRDIISLETFIYNFDMQDINEAITSYILTSVNGQTKIVVAFTLECGPGILCSYTWP